ncbi:hypothetical protein [Polaromonas sp. CG9_12]|nr:hypothetical protein [Polaromonas sp. CG9_12]
MNPLHRIHRIATAILALGFVLLLAALGQALSWGLERTPPFVLLGYTANAARPGEQIVVHARVQRDLTRRCSVTYSRSFYDAAGTRYDLTQGDVLMNAAALDDLSRRMPRELVFGITAPRSATPGRAAIVTALDYVCNPMHLLYPIGVMLTMDVDILNATGGPP